jgi:hypothetical protein
LGQIKILEVWVSDTVYIGEALEYAKALYLGIADGAKNNWLFLEQHTSR